MDPHCGLVLIGCGLFLHQTPLGRQGLRPWANTRDIRAFFALLTGACERLLLFHCQTTERFLLLFLLSGSFPIALLTGESCFICHGVILSSPWFM